MKFESQFCPPHLALKLLNAGVEANARFTFLSYPMGICLITTINEDKLEPVVIYQRGKMDETPIVTPAFSVAELGVMLPQGAATCFDSKNFNWIARIDFLDEARTRIEVKGKTEVQARAKLLLELLDRKLAILDMVNKRLDAL